MSMLGPDDKRARVDLFIFNLARGGDSFTNAYQRHDSVTTISDSDDDVKSTPNLLKVKAEEKEEEDRNRAHMQTTRALLLKVKAEEEEDGNPRAHADAMPGSVEDKAERSKSRSPPPWLRRAPSKRSLKQVLEYHQFDDGRLASQLAVVDDSQVFQTGERSTELNQMQLSTMKRASDLALPIDFHYAWDRNCSATLKEVIYKYDVDRFYIGATVDPIRRWVGSACTDRGEPMKGHRRAGWNCMIMIGAEDDARQLEKRLIVESKQRWPDKCTNIAEDTRGQCRGPNWIYVCIGGLAER